MSDAPLESDHAVKVALFDRAAEVATALGSGRRLEIIDLLAQGERSVEEVARETHQSVQSASHHLRRLAIAHLVATRREGARVYYRLRSREVAELWLQLTRVSAQLDRDVEALAAAYLGPEELAGLRAADVIDRMADGSLVVLDVRPEEEWRAAHLPGAVPAPLVALREVPTRLAPGSEVIVYCRGPWCAYASIAVRWLRDRGIEARRLEDGFLGWLVDGRAVESGSTEVAEG
ncbi:transcriptional regulator, ArsR family [Acidimicrobium ferrooxidans DSM 10331]|uniref:Transcriptional regulator, ArsR family n=1 Tax=Acidimicrobium ferrooxidans (strain DSM 10331 / JCM 15462 / NBRC 103882 / ICP) TaxID=525909 RepID=C7LZE6_ACIFD|nr:metalloregulator ArsR/SmtB family transcription factor [Acidimicrobium ferrooxidans]ACU54104.1 transcriptional regulator, ArsR family [Acidimicrobium ferrooxidans DSM 10331]